jgi:hypothetical protein
LDASGDCGVGAAAVLTAAGAAAGAGCNDALLSGAPAVAAPAAEGRSLGASAVDFAGVASGILVDSVAMASFGAAWNSNL